ncbi:phosphoribosyltransferase [Actinomycetota bacterium Odt1-20B]
MVFPNRRVAGRLLAEQVARLPHWSDGRAVRAVIGVSEGGVPVAHEVARHLRVPLDVTLVRRISAPGNPELTIGAVGENGMLVCADTFLRRFASEGPLLPELAREAGDWLARRARLLRGGHPPVDVKGCEVVLVEDGVVTGTTARAAVGVLRRRGAKDVVLAVPVAPPQVLHQLRPLVTEIACTEIRDISDTDACYRDHRPTPDSEISRLLAASRAVAVGQHTPNDSHSPVQGRSA